MAVFSIENLFEAIRLNKLEMVATILKEYPSWVNVHDHRGFYSLDIVRLLQS